MILCGVTRLLPKNRTMHRTKRPDAQAVCGANPNQIEMVKNSSKV